MPSSWFPYTSIDPPFSKEARRTINKFIGRKSSYDFYDIHNSSNYGGRGEDIHFDPLEVLETLRSLRSALKKHQLTLPVFYWFHMRGEKRRGTNRMRVFINGVKTGLWGDWDSCLMVTGFGPGRRLKKKDISQVKRVSCNELIDKEENDGWVEVEGREIIVQVEKQTIYEYWRRPLDGMIDVCRHAHRNGFCVQGVLR